MSDTAKRRNTDTARWYLCECDRKACREEFYMRRDDYERVTLGNGKLVVPKHKPVGVKVLARWSDVVMIERKERK